MARGLLRQAIDCAQQGRAPERQPGAVPVRVWSESRTSRAAGTRLPGALARTTPPCRHWRGGADGGCDPVRGELGRWSMETVLERRPSAGQRNEAFGIHLRRVARFLGPMAARTGLRVPLGAGLSRRGSTKRPVQRPIFVRGGIPVAYPQQCRDLPRYGRFIAQRMQVSWLSTFLMPSVQDGIEPVINGEPHPGPSEEQLLALNQRATALNSQE